MKLIIDIPEELYRMCKSCLGDADCIESAIANGTPIACVKEEIENSARDYIYIMRVFEILDNVGKKRR